MAVPIISGLNLQPEAAVAWVATFLLHSTLLICSIWLLTRLLGMKAMAIQDRLWKVALFGALFSCTVQAGLGDGAIAPRISLEAGDAAPFAVTAGPTAQQPFSGQLAGRSFAPAVREQIRRLLPVPWQRLILLLWGLGAACFTGGLALQLLRLRSRFRGRRELDHGPVHRIFQELIETRPTLGRAIKLTVSERIPAPVACGIRRPEICLPLSMVRGTAPEQVKSVLAHELAHIVRRDQVWLLAARLAEGIFFFQPLVRLARRCYQETAEFICDGEAVRQTGERVPLARSLHQLARRRVSTPTALTIPGISGRGSPLNRRIEMILDKNRPAVAHGRARWFGPLAAALILVFAFLAPGVTAGDDPPPHPQEVPPAEAEREMAAEAEAMEQLEREMAAQEAAMAQVELEMAEQQVAMELAEQEMVQAEREMEAEAAEMAELEREMELVEQELATDELERAQAERELAEQEEALIREIEELREQADDEGAGRLDAETEEEIRRRREEIRERHREIVMEHREISRQHRDAARRQAESLHQRRAVYRSEEAALRAQRRGLERALREMETSLDGDLAGEQRERLTAIQLDLEEKLRALEEKGSVEQAAAKNGPVPRPEELE